MGARDKINLDALARACRKRKVDIHAILAEALTESQRENAQESGMNMKAQADLAWKIMDKLEASKKAIEHSGETGMVVTLQSRDADL